MNARCLCGVAQTASLLDLSFLTRSYSARNASLSATSGLLEVPVTFVCEICNIK